MIGMPVPSNFTGEQKRAATAIICAVVMGLEDIEKFWKCENRMWGSCLILNTGLYKRKTVELFFNDNLFSNLTYKKSLY